MFFIFLLVAVAESVSLTASPQLMKNAPRFMKAAKKDDSTEDDACADEFTTLTDCIDGTCLICVGTIILDFDESTTCTALAEGTFCDDWYACMTGPCATNSCGESCEAEGSAWEACMEEEYEMEESMADEACDTLCEATQKFAFRGSIA